MTQPLAFVTASGKVFPAALAFRLGAQSWLPPLTNFYYRTPDEAEGALLASGEAFAEWRLVEPDYDNLLALYYVHFGAVPRA